jgi:hypothetical protein
MKAHHFLGAFLVGALLVLLLLLTPYSSQAQLAGQAFGGSVTNIQVCNDGELVTLREPLEGTIQLMWLYGELPYLMFIPPINGQDMIGMASLVLSQCYLGYSYEGQGWQIEYHGEDAVGGL